MAEIIPGKVGGHEELQGSRVQRDHPQRMRGCCFISELFWERGGSNKRLFKQCN